MPGRACKTRSSRTAAALPAGKWLPGELKGRAWLTGSWQPDSMAIRSRPATADDDPGTLERHSASVVVAPHLLDPQAVALQQDLQLAGKEERQIELDGLALLTSKTAEPAVMKCDVLGLRAGAA